MKEKIAKIFELPAPAKIGILVGTLLLVGAGFYFGMYQATQEELNALMQENENLRTNIVTKTKIVSNLKFYEERVALLNKELDKALKELPNKQELDDLLAGISDKAKESGLEIKLFKPKGDKKKGFYAEVPVNLIVNGTYHEVATFFDEVAHLERVVNLSNISMGTPVPKDGAIVLDTSVVVTGYRFLEHFLRQREKEKEQEEKDQNKKKKRGRR